MQALSKQTLKIFFSHAARYKWALAYILVGALLVTNAVDITRPFLYKYLIDSLVNFHGNDIGPLLRIPFYILGIGIIHWFTWRSVEFINNYFQPRVMSDLLNTCYDYLHGHSYNFFNNSFVGSIVTKVRRYQKAFEEIADQVCFELGRTAVRIVAIIIALWTQHWIFAAVVFAWLVLYVIFTYIFSRYKLQYDLKRAQQDTLTTAQLADTITNQLNVKLFSAFKRESGTFRAITQELFRIRKLSWDLGTISNVIQGALFVILEFTIMYLAIIYWHRGTLSLGDFALLQSYFVQMMDRLWNVGKQIRTIYENLADANEMTEMLIQPHEVQDRPGVLGLVVSRGQIEFRDVDFAYDGQHNIFNNFNLLIKPGERVALVGPSGGGKSSIVKLLFRFFDIQGGEILVDNQNINKVTQTSLRRNIGLVPQEPILFHRSLMENIRYGRPEATDEEVIAAAKLAHCHEFISATSEGYETFVGERGVKLSGGERQRVAIARAILKNAPILVLDEATSSLDSESEFYIQDALKNLMEHKTTIVIAHRLSTIMQMDRIVVIEAGRIIEEGKHEELVKAQQGMYQKLWHIQAGGFAPNA